MKLNEERFKDRAFSVFRAQQISSRNEALQNIRDDLLGTIKEIKTQSTVITKLSMEFDVVCTVQHTALC